MQFQLSKSLQISSRKARDEEVKIKKGRKKEGKGKKGRTKEGKKERKKEGITGNKGREGE